MPLLSIEDCRVAYRGAGGEPRWVLNGLDLAIGAGESLALIGESGSGKSTLGLAVCGLLTEPGVTAGARRFCFAERAIPLGVQRPLPRPTAGVSMVFQDAMSALDPVWTVGSQLVAAIRSNPGAGGAVGAAEARRIAADWLQRVELTETDRVMRARPYELSGGMRQRVMLAVAVCTTPRLLVADEPTSALDPSTALEAMRLMADLVARLGIALLLISHDIALSSRFTDRTAILHRGRIVEEGRSREFAAMARHPYATGLLRCVPTLAAADLDWLPTMELARTASVSTRAAPKRANV